MATEEIVLTRRSFVPAAIPADAVVRCANCNLVDPHRRGHDLNDCNLALREEVKRLNTLIIPTQRQASE